MPNGTQTPIPNPYWRLCRYLVPNTFLILWFFSKLVAFTPAIFPPLTASSLLFILRLSSGVLFPSLALPLPLTPASRASPSSFISPHAPSLYTSTMIICVLGNYIQNMAQAWCSPGHTQSEYKLATLASVQSDHMSACWGVTFTHQAFNPLKIRAVFYSPVHHQSPAHGRCLISICGFNH